MPEDNDTKMVTDPGYVLGQLRRAITTASEHLDVAVRQRALKRIERWEQVLRGNAW